eukprot:4409157-Ditylum_brightwellii.AAC.1
MDGQNYVIVSIDKNKNGCLVTRSKFLHNTKVSASKFNEDVARQKERDSGHPRGRNYVLEPIGGRRPKSKM